MFGRWSWFFVWMFGFGDPNLGVAGNQGVVRNWWVWIWCRVYSQKWRVYTEKKKSTPPQTLWKSTFSIIWCRVCSLIIDIHHPTDFTLYIFLDAFWVLGIEVGIGFFTTTSLHYTFGCLVVWEAGNREKGNPESGLSSALFPWFLV